MKKVLLCLVLCLLLSGCGSLAGERRVESPYLSAAERDAFETQLLDSIYFSPTGTDGMVMCFHNDFDYDIIDLLLIGENQGTTQMFFDLVPANTTVAKSLYLSEQERDSKYRLQYTIGKYHYRSEGISIDFGRRNEENGDSSNIQVFLRTVDGEIPLILSEPISFATGREIKGVKDSKIYSIEGNVLSLDNYISLILDLEGTLPANGTKLVAKLVDKDGIIREICTCSNAYSQSGVLKLILGSHVEQGKYYLQFEEIG